METNGQIKFNDLTRDFLEDYIAKMPKEEKIKLKEYVAKNPRDKSANVFTLVKSYIYNTYFRQTPVQERKRTTFADVLVGLLDDANIEEEKEDYTDSL